MGMRILPRLVDVERMVGMLHRRHGKPARDLTRDDMGEERGLARTAPTSEANDAHAGTIAGQRVPGAVQREGNPARSCLRASPNLTRPTDARRARVIGCLRATPPPACVLPAAGR